MKQWQIIVNMVSGRSCFIRCEWYADAITLLERFNDCLTAVAYPDDYTIEDEPKVLSRLYAKHLEPIGTDRLVINLVTVESVELTEVPE